MKKGQGLSLNTIIIAIMVIIVLVIIILITTGQLQKFTQGVNNQANEDCINAGGLCTSQDACTNLGGKVYSSASCTGEQVCCVRNT